LKYCEQGDVKKLKKYLRKHERSLRDVDFDEFFDHAGCTPLMVAAAHGHFDVCKYLLKHVDVRLNKRHELTGDTAVHIAARDNLVDLLLLFRQHDAKQRQQSATSNSKLRDCMKRKNVDGKTPNDLLSEAEARALRQQSAHRLQTTATQAEKLRNEILNEETEEEREWREKLLSV
jgi:ankyrin repeat protein